MTISFEGQVALVTGAGNGLGRSHALELAKRGAKVIVNDFGGARDGTGGSLSPAETVVEEIVNAGGEAMANGANVALYDDCEAMVEDAISKWGRVDVLVNNAGFAGKGPELNPQIARSTLDVNYRGVRDLTQALQPSFARGARIVNISSGMGVLDPSYDDAVRDARLLMRWACGLDGAGLALAMDTAPAPEQAEAFAAGIARRAARAPGRYDRVGRGRKGGSPDPWRRERFRLDRPPRCRSSRPRRPRSRR